MNDTPNPGVPMLTWADAATIAQRYRLGPVASLTGPTATGMQGAVWRLRTSDGDYAVKVPLRPQDEGEMRANAAFTRAAIDVGVLAPAALRTTAGDLLTDLAAGRPADAPTQVRVYAWVDLDDADLGIDPGAVGRVLGLVHRVGAPTTEAVDPWYTETVGERAWAALARAASDGGAPFAADLTAVTASVSDLEDLVRPPSGLRICHRDLWADNVRTTPGGRLCVIDWDNAGPADPAGELAMVLTEFATDAAGRVDPGRARRLLDAYADAGGPARLREPGDFSMVVCVLGHILELHVRSWLRGEERNRSEAGVAEFLDRRVTRSTIEGLLAV
ncbi:aminoglycoside phosphotransferase family protein [Occultella glacieicola]|uniref:Aminoglycoside phosphotransferase family protein n=1 Tax=Occultella glacieicola TaxID=2518684 RepID=A0ABY2E5C9_9MICO|nr:phosphotransferase [Occultella glacieicola]TDE95796.1 aminoglycoside phosphotransferase family protein [Occultella glacieicola]